MMHLRKITLAMKEGSRGNKRNQLQGRFRVAALRFGAQVERLFPLEA